MKLRGRFLVVLFIVASAAASTRSDAGGSQHFTGCYDCVYSVTWGDPFSEDAQCVAVQPNSWGDGIYCRTYSWDVFSRDCTASGGACYSIEVVGALTNPARRAKRSAAKHQAANAVLLF
jgi:hypothetical protein